MAVPPTVAKIHARLLPLFVALVILNYLDRTALAFAALQLCHEPWFDARTLGVGSAIFSVGYVTLQVPSNLVLARVGARVWLPLLTAAWGAVAACGALIRGPTSFFLWRFALGTTEAGAFPAMWAICGQWYPPSFITLPYSVIEASIALSQIVAAPVAALLLQLAGVGGLAGWQWLFIALGSSTVLLAGVLRWRLPSSLATASFLNESDKAWLLQHLGPAGVAGGALTASGDGLAYELPDTRADGGGMTVMRLAGSGGDTKAVAAPGAPSRQPAAAAAAPAPAGCGAPSEPDGAADAARRLLHANDSDQPQHQLQQQRGAHTPQRSAWQQLVSTARNRWLWYLAGLKALKDVSMDGLTYFLPLLLHALLERSAAAPLSHQGAPAGASKHCGSKASQLQAVLLSAVPFGAAALAAVALGHSSEARSERHRHIGVPLLLGGAAFAAMPLLLPLHSRVPAFLAVTAATIAADATTGPFWAWVHLAAGTEQQAVAFAAVNSLGKAGGMLGPLSFGLLLHATGSYAPASLLVAGVLLAAGAMALLYPGEARARPRHGFEAAREERDAELVSLQRGGVTHA